MGVNMSGNFINTDQCISVMLGDDITEVFDNPHIGLSQWCDGIQPLLLRLLFKRGHRLDEFFCHDIINEYSKITVIDGCRDIDYALHDEIISHDRGNIELYVIEERSFTEDKTINGFGFWNEYIRRRATNRDILDTKNQLIIYDPRFIEQALGHKLKTRRSDCYAVWGMFE